MDDERLEPYQFATGKTEVGSRIAAKCAAVEYENAPLTAWLDACPVPTDDSSESVTNRAEMVQSLAVALRASLPAEDCHRLAMLLEAPDDLPTD